MDMIWLIGTVMGIGFALYIIYGVSLRFFRYIMNKRKEFKL